MGMLPDVAYRVACISLSIPLLSDRHKLLCFKLFDAMKDTKRKLHDLLPLKRENTVSARK